MCPVVDGSVIEEYQAIEKGTWEGVLKEASYEENEKGKGPYYKCTFVVSEPPYENQNAWRNLSLTPKALVFFKQTMVALGADPSVFAGKFDSDEVVQSVIGNPCRIVTDEPDAEYDGTPRTVVKKILAPTIG